MAATAFAGSDTRIADGALVCPSCFSWFPVRDRLLEFLPADLIDPSTARMLADRHGAALAGVGLTPDRMGQSPAHPISAEDRSKQLAQRQHFDWYADNPGADYADYAEMPFWTAVDALTFKRWQPLLAGARLVLDVGCANGRSAFPLMAPDRTVIGFDISAKMLRQSIARAEREGVAERSAFFVSDGSSLPFKDGTFDCVQTYGVLHHLPNPGAVEREIVRTLKVGGVHLGSENNETAFRKIFDLMMKLLPIWHEEAGDEPLISHAMIDDWTAGIKVEKTVVTSVFLPPHLANLLGSAAHGAIKLSDRLFTSLPWLKDNGGLIIFEVKKLA